MFALGLPAKAASVRVFANSAHQIAFQGKSGKPGSNLQEAFEKKTGIKVVWETVPYPQMRQTLMRALASSSSQYDVVMVENSWAAPDVLDKLASIEIGRRQGRHERARRCLPGDA